MGEISFSYAVKPEFAYQAPFTYWYAESIEYSFAYQRYIAFSDASIFDNPVAITKVATGLFDLHDLFVDKEAYSIVRDKITEIHKVPHDIVRDEITELDKVSFKISLNDLFIMERHNAFNMDIYPNSINMIRPVPFLNAIPQINMARPRNGMFLDDEINMYRIGHDKGAYDYRYFMLMRENSLNISEKYLFGKRPDNYGYVTQNFMGQRPDLYGSKFWNDLLERPDLCGNVFDSINMQRPDLSIGSVFKNISGVRPDISINVLKYHFLELPYIIRTNVIDTQVLYKPFSETVRYETDVILDGMTKKGNTEDLFELYTYGKTFDWHEQIFGTMYGKLANIRNEVSGKTYGKRAERLQEFYGFKIAYQAIINDIAACMLPDKEMFRQKTLGARTFDKPTCKFNLDTFSVTEVKYMYLIDDTWGTIEPKEMGIRDIEWLYKGGREMRIHDITWAISDKKGMFLTEGVYGKGQKKDIDIHVQPIFISKDSQNLGIFDDLLTINFILKPIRIHEQPFDISKDEADIRLYQPGLFAFKDSFSIELYTDQTWVYNDRKSIEFIPNTVTLSKIKKGIPENNEGVFAYKDRTSIEFWHSVEWTFKDRKSFVIDDSVVSAYKDMFDIRMYNEQYWTYKNSHDIELYPHQLWGQKDGHDIRLFQQGNTLIKQLISTTDLPDVDSAIKYHMPTDFIGNMNGNYAGMIIPVSKLRKQGYVNNIDLMAKKYFKHAFINQDQVSSVIPKSTYVPTIDLMCDKQEHRAFVEYKNNSIVKSRIHSIIHHDIFAEKGMHKAHVFEYESVIKELHKAWIQNPISAFKEKKNLQVHYDINAYREYKKADISDSLFVDKSDRICYYDYGTVWADKEIKAQLDQVQVQGFRKPYDTHILDCVSSGIKKHVPVFYEYGVFGNKIIRESQLFKEIEHLESIRRETMLHPNDFGNWAWVYETPDPFEGRGYGIDELLLPENDTRYEGFQDIIFNKETMMPRNPVKQIDDTTFIGKYPTKHPLPKYSDVGIDYDKSAVKFEQYLGIETDILHTVFLKFYRIWQSKIFEFGTMTMVQSVKLMLDYMYAWIMDYFPLDELEQALRVFRLIRWYAESSIIQNSQYIISYEFDTLESKLNTGVCHIPCNLDDSNPTMMVDPVMGVIKNNPIYIGSGKAYVEFYINNKKNTTISFSLSNTVGSVNIYINDVLIDTVSKSALHLIYELPYTGDENVVRIEKEASHNLNGNFYIGNIKIPNCSFKDLSIEFDPTLKAGNKPLNDVAKKMIELANRYEDVQEAYNVIRKANLGISETYKRMVDYWNLHHQDKTKGKRLTIKEV